MKTIAIVSQKGGAGKTTLALHLAAAYSLAGSKAVLLDLDPQASAAEWADARGLETPAVLAVPPARLEPVLSTARDSGADVVVIDTAPHSETSAMKAIKAADIVLVPCKPSILDLRALSKTIELLELSKALERAFAVLNGVPHVGTDGDQAEQSITNSLGLQVAPVRLGDRVAFRRCMIEGLTVLEFEPHGKAAEEVKELLSFVSDKANMLYCYHDNKEERRA